MPNQHTSDPGSIQCCHRRRHAQDARLIASGVTAVTTALEGRFRGVTVNAFTAVSLEPPLVLIALATETTSCEMIAESGIFAVNILSEEQEFLSERLAARAPLVKRNL